MSGPANLLEKQIYLRVQPQVLSLLSYVAEPDSFQHDVDKPDIRLRHEFEHGYGGGDWDHPARHDDALEQRHAGEVLIHRPGQDQS